MLASPVKRSSSRCYLPWGLRDLLARDSGGLSEKARLQWRIHLSDWRHCQAPGGTLAGASAGLSGGKNGYGQRFLPALLCRAQGQVWTRVSGVRVSAGRWAEETRPAPPPSAVLGLGKRAERLRRRRAEGASPRGAWGLRPLLEPK